MSEELETEVLENQEVENKEEELENQTEEIEKEDDSDGDDIHEDFKDLGEKAKVKAQKRYNKITAQKYKAIEEVNIANAENRALKERLENIEAKLAGSGPTQTVEEAANKPTRDDFDDEDDYIDAITEFKAEEKINKILTAKETKAAKAKLQKEQNDYQTNVIENFKTKTQEAMDANEDYLDVTSNIQIPLDSELGKEILESEEHGANIMYQLGNDPVLFAKINKLSGKKLTKEIGILEASLKKADKNPKKKKPKAPDAANVNRRATVTTGKPNMNEVSPEEYYRLSCTGKI